MSLSVPAFVELAITVAHVWPKSVDLATSITLLLFCSQDAYTVFPSTGSTLTCTSICSTLGSVIGRGADQDLPLSLETTRYAVELAQPLQLGGKIGDQHINMPKAIGGYGRFPRIARQGRTKSGLWLKGLSEE